MAAIEITELLGDGIGPELAQAVHAVAAALPVTCHFEAIDWSLATRERDTDAAIDAAEESMRRTKLALKYPTVTKTRSPNALLRRRLNFSVIYRPSVSIDGIESNFKAKINMHVVRVATGGTYEDGGQMIGKDAAVSIRLVERQPCRQAATFAFELARKTGMSVTSASKYTIQRVTDGLFEAEVKATHSNYPDVSHQVELFDALLGKTVLKPDFYQIVLVLNEYGDFLSDMASGLVGSLGTGASGNYSFTDDLKIDIAMFDPAGGTAPDIAGKNRCNPTAILLAFAMLLDHAEHYNLGHALRLSLFDAIRAKQCTRDIGGDLSTTAFTEVVVGKLPKFLSAND